MPPFRSILKSVCFTLAFASTFSLLPAQSVHPGVGANPYSGGVSFRVWAPNATTVNVAGQFNSWSKSANSLVAEGGGYWSVDVPGAAAGQQYKFVINQATSSIWKRDPRARLVVNSNDNSIIVDPDAYNWGGANTFVPPPVNEMVIYEMHIGTFNDSPGGSPGTFSSAIARLDHLQDLGVNVIELMPINEFPGDYSWGYNPSDPYTVENTAYGGVTGLKDFVKECHARDMAVLLDVLYNHFGPSDLDLWEFDGWSEDDGGGIYFYNQSSLRDTPWGPRPDYRRPEVVDYISDNIEFWINEYRMDGFRWDAVGMIRDTNYGGGTSLPEGKQMIRDVNDMLDASYPNVINIAEDVQSWGDITQPTSNSSGFGFDSQWSNFHYYIRHEIEQSTDAARDMNSLAFGLNGALYGGAGDAWKRVISTETHDEVANGKSRVPAEIDNANPGSYLARKLSTAGAAMVFTAPGIPMIFQGQEILEDGWFQDTDPIDWTKATTYSGILQLYTDLIALRKNVAGKTAGLTGPNINVFHVNNGSTSKVVAFHRWDAGGEEDDVVVIANFANKNFPVYNIGFPASGDWVVRFNSDSTTYSSDFGGAGSTAVSTVATPMHGFAQSGSVELPPYTVLILSQDNSSDVDDWKLYD